MANIAGRVVSPSTGRVVSQRTIGMPATSPAAAESGRSSGSDVVRPSHGSSCRRRSALRSAATTPARPLNDSMEISGHSGCSATTLPSTASGFSWTNNPNRARAASIASDCDTSNTLVGPTCWATATCDVATIVTASAAAVHRAASPSRRELAHRVSSPGTVAGTDRDPRSPGPVFGGASAICNRVATLSAYPSLRCTSARSPRRGWCTRRCA